MPNGLDAFPPTPPQDAAPPPFREPWAPYRRRLLRWLEEKSPPLAELYETAVIFLDQQEIRGRSRIISHCVREIANALPAILAGVERTRLEYDKRVEEITLSWERIGRPRTLSPTGMTATSIPGPQEALTQELLNRIEQLIKDHKATRAKSDTIAERLFRANRPENRHLGDALRPVLRRWIKLREWFVGHSHDNNKTDAERDWSDFRSRFILFERTVLTLGQGFFETIADLDELIRTSTPADVHLVVAQLGHIEHYKYFFEHLEDPAWIPALRAEGLFRTPPPITDTGIPRWAASEFLVRVAGRADPIPVMNALSDIADTLHQQTSVNPLIIRDIVNVLLKLPAAQSTQFVQKLSKWTGQNNGVFFCRQLAKLTTHLAEGEMSHEALTILAALLAIERVQTEDPSDYFPKPVKPRISMHEYRKIVEEHLQPVLQSNGPALLDVLCNTLKKAAKLSRRSRSSEEWNDNCIVWQPNLNIQDEDDRDDVRSVLAGATRNTAKSLLADGRIELGRLIEALESRRWLIFRRLALHFLASSTSAPRDMIASRLTHEQSFRDRNLRMEYEALLHVGFVSLTPDEQQTILGWIEAGPENVEQMITNYELSYGRPPNTEEIGRIRRAWEWRRLSPCHTVLLSPTWRERYAALVEEFGEYEAPPPTMREARVVDVNERAPRSEEELRTFTPDALREYLINWTPDRTSFPYPTQSGLAQVLTSLVTAAPDVYADACDHWQGIDPTLVHGIIRGFVKALEANHHFSWERVLSLCSWILDQPRTIPGRSVDRFEGDPDWGGTRWWIVELLRVGFRHETLRIPITIQGVVWRLLEVLTMDPDPDMDDEEEDMGHPSQSMHRAINSVRGRAIEGLMFCPEWIKAQTGDLGPARLPSKARGLLDMHLNIDTDPSLAIRSLYGRWFPWFLVFDRDWAGTVINKIFTDVDHTYWLVAWDGFISFNNAYDELFEPLQLIYEKAVTQLGRQDDETDDTRHLRDERLAGHLMTYYWLGRYPLEETTGLIRQFFGRASDKIRSEAVEFIGRSLDRTAGTIEPVILDRLQRLWAWRFEQAIQNPAMHQAELKAFGWCFGSSKFDARWAIDNLLGVLRLTGNIDPDFQVLERLQGCVSQFPIEALECVKLLIEGQTSYIELSSWEEDLRGILTQTREHPTAAVRRAGNEVIELLGRIGYVGYRDLLSPE